MDPAIIVGLVSSAAALATLCGSAVKDLSTLVSKYKNAKLAILSMVQGLDTMQLAWSRIGKWAQNQAPDELLEEDDFIGRLRRSLETGSLVMDALNEELLIYKPSKMGLTQRTKVVWNEGNLRIHQERIRDQASSMTLLLQAIHLPTLGDRNRLLRESEEQFGKSDESAYSIVPSRMSMSIYTGQTIDSGASKSEEDLIYRPLTFENELFTARVYKRNYRTSALYQLFKRTEQNIREPGHTQWSQNEARVITSRRPEGQLAGDEDTLLSRISERRPLYLAVQAGNVDMVRYLLDYGTNVAAPDGENAQAIHVAAGCGSTVILSLLLDRGAAIDSAMTNGDQPLHVASQHPDRANVIRFLCSQGADIEAKTDRGYTPLYYASVHNHVDNMKALLELGAVHNPQDLSILGIAVQRGYLQATRLLLGSGVNPNGSVYDPVYGERTALHKLFKSSVRYHLNNYAEIVELLLVYGADVDIRDWNGDTPLHCLCSREVTQFKEELIQEQLAKILLRNMTRDVDTVNFTGKTALGLSMERRSRGCLKRSLVDYGARLLLSRPGIEIRFRLEESSGAHLSVLKCYLRHGSNTVTKILGDYEKDGQKSIVPLDNPWTEVVLRGLLANPQLLSSAILKMPIEV